MSKLPSDEQLAALVKVLIEIWSYQRCNDPLTSNLARLGWQRVVELFGLTPVRDQPPPDNGTLRTITFYAAYEWAHPYEAGRSWKTALEIVRRCVAKGASGEL